MTRSGESVRRPLYPHGGLSPATTVDELGGVMLGYDASLSVDFLYDHGWQVSISNPGGHLYVHGGTNIKPEAWVPGGSATLLETIAEAFARAERKGWL
jgi:hypothetical protein